MSNECYSVIVTTFCNCVSEGRRNALQDYQKTDSIQLVVHSDSSHLTKSRKLTLSKCAKACSRNKRLPFTCRFVRANVITLSVSGYYFGNMGMAFSSSYLINVCMMHEF